MKNVQIITVELKIEDDVSLMILLHQDGTINRKGDGSFNIDNNFFMGLDEDNGFTDLMQAITPEFEQFLNKVYDIPDKKGKTCTLEIILTDGKETTGMRFIYGAASMGPPLPVTDFVKRAVEITNPWYLRQQKMVRKNESKWWEIWK